MALKCWSVRHVRNQGWYRWPKRYVLNIIKFMVFNKFFHNFLAGNKANYSRELRCYAAKGILQCNCVMRKYSASTYFRFMSFNEFADALDWVGWGFRRQTWLITLNITWLRNRQSSVPTPRPHTPSPICPHRHSNQPITAGIHLPW